MPRSWFLLMLCLAVTWQAWAGTPRLIPTCPHAAQMAAAMPQSAADPADADLAADDCCNDLATFVRTGQACQTDAGCQLAWVGLAPEAGPLQAAPPAQTLASGPAPPRSGPRHAPIWRPPTRG